MRGDTMSRDSDLWTEPFRFKPVHLFNLTEGTRIEWCETHEASFFGLDRCGAYLFAEPVYDGDPDPGRCVVASRVVVDV